jgi:hypothetical protein
LYLVIALAGFLTGYFAAGGFSAVFCAGKPPAGNGFDTAGIDHAEKLTGDIRAGLNSLEESLGTGRNEVDQGRSLVGGSIPELGSIGSGLDTITGRLGEAQERVGRIEEAGRRIEQALSALTEGKAFLDDHGD